MSPGGNVRQSLIERAAGVGGFAEALARPLRPASIGGDATAAQADPIGPPSMASFSVTSPLSAGPAGVARVAREALAEAGFVLPDMVPTALSEEFRVVKRQLLADIAAPGASSRLRTILVTSARPDDGKTFCAINLALSMAREKGLEILLVDADFAKPEILSTLGLPGGPGLIDILGEPGLDPAACIIPTDIPNLSILPAGRASNEATELLASPRMKTLCEELSSTDDRIVIFDSSPALASSSALVLAGLVGQLLMVVRADVTSEADLREALGLLRGCDHMRLLLNATELKPLARRFTGYYGQGG